MRISDWSSDVCSSDLLGDAKGVFDPRVARADDRDVAVLEILWIVDLINDVRQVVAGAAQAVRIALGADRQADRFGGDGVALRGLDAKGALRAGDLDHLGIKDAPDRSDDRRVGKGCGSTVGDRG